MKMSDGQYAASVREGVKKVNLTQQIERALTQYQALAAEIEDLSEQSEQLDSKNKARTDLL